MSWLPPQIGPFVLAQVKPTAPTPGQGPPGQPPASIPGMTGTEQGFGPNLQPRGKAGDLLITPEVAAKLPPAPGILVPGTLDPYNRVKILRPGGGYETMLTRGVELDGGRIAIIPSVVGGRELSRDEAIQHFYQTHEHFGIFSSREAADAYDKALHDQIEPGSYERGVQTMQGPFTRAGY